MTKLMKVKRITLHHGRSGSGVVYYGRYENDPDIQYHRYTHAAADANAEGNEQHSQVPPVRDFGVLLHLWELYEYNLDISDCMKYHLPM